VPPADARAAVLDATDGLGADIVIEAAGSDGALQAALGLARGRGTVTVVGAHFEHDHRLDAGLMFERELTLRFAIGDPLNDRERLLGMMLRGELAPEKTITHRLPLDEAPGAYRLFDERRAVKVVLLP
jgi:threonine dehydrogenase-like Zn-dependent dehydrogenase